MIDFFSILILLFIPVTIGRDANYVFQHPDCLPQQARPVGISDNRVIPDSSMWSSTDIRDERSAKFGRLMDDKSCWSPSRQDSFQFLAVDLGRRFIITKIQTQGKRGSDEFITEYGLEVSDDNNTWSVYTNEFGIPNMFRGNVDGSNVVDKSLRYPAIARYIRIIPVRWSELISLRLEVLGCVFESDVARFYSDGAISFDISEQMPLQTYEDTFLMRFKTVIPDGILFYGSGNQGDYFSIEMKHGYLHLNLNLGSTPHSPGNTTQVGGSLLDDGQWHDVIIVRQEKSVKFVVDRLETLLKTQGVFSRLDLDKYLYLGGVPAFNADGISVRQNFTGCVENAVFNNLKMIRDMTLNQPRFQRHGNINFACELLTEPPITFPSYDSRLEVQRDAANNVRIKFDFRSYEEEVLMLYAPLEGDDMYVKLMLNEFGYVQYSVQALTSAKVTVTVEDKVQKSGREGLHGGFTDGLWHNLTLDVYTNKIECAVDLYTKKSERDIVISSTGDYFIGGYETDSGFRGCMRNILVAAKPVELSSGFNDYVRDGAAIGTCSIIDRCTPQPCEHQGICSQNWGRFYCDCAGTGYFGEVCHTSAHPLSCAHHKLYSVVSGDEIVTIDPDGSGPMVPFSVKCSYGNGDDVNSVETHISHNSIAPVLVDGFEEPGSYVRLVKYDAELPALTEVIERAFSCKQSIKYACLNSRLLAATGNNEWPHFGWWVGRTYQPMYYWGGASPGSGKCACGLSESGCDSNSKTCHCDSLSTNWKADEGSLEHKDYLPVLELHFGDTGTSSDNKQGRHTLGDLVCTGDNMFDNVVTFRKSDGTIKLPTFQAESSGDIWFQFKTTARDGVFMQNTEYVSLKTTSSLDFVEIRISNGDSIQFRFNVGNGLQVLEFRSPSALNNNEWHTVHVERNRKQAWLRVDNYPPRYVMEAQDEMTRILELTTPLIIGATVDYRDGFVGCMRALRINGILMDLRGMVHRGEYTYGVNEGCIGKCDNHPCFNGGTCKEMYSSYTCDCAYTPFRGWMCGREVGANMQTNFIIKYEFDDKQGFSATDFQYARVGFSTKKKQGILFQISNEPNTEYISCEINNNGGIKVFFDVGSFDRFESNSQTSLPDLTNGQQHEVVVTIGSDETNPRAYIRIKVDDYPHFDKKLPTESTSDTVLNDPKYVFIGNNNTETPNRGFEGCIFRMQIDNIYPLKRAFQEPRPSYMSLLGDINEDMCGFEELTQAPDALESRPGDGILVNVTYPVMTDKPLTEEEKITIGVVVGLFIIILIICVLLVIKYVFKKGGDYETEEAKGAELADNPDTAVVYNQTGAVDISKRREWFM